MGERQLSICVRSYASLPVAASLLSTAFDRAELGPPSRTAMAASRMIDYRRHGGTIIRPAFAAQGKTMTESPRISMPPGALQDFASSRWVN